MVDKVSPEKTKLILGLVDDQKMQFWKMQSIENGYCPIIYNLAAAIDPNRVGRINPELDRRYAGNWITFDNLEDYASMLMDIPEIMSAESAEREEANQLLAGIAKPRLDPYFSLGLMDAIKIHGHPGSLVLRKKE